MADSGRRNEATVA